MKSISLRRSIKRSVLLGLSGALGLSSLYGGGLKYKDGDKYLKLGGRIQVQYHQNDPDGGTSTDTLRFRRLRPYIEGSLHKNWKGKWQWDFGKEKTAIKDNYLQYKGFKTVNVTIGNASFQFSRELLTSSKYQQIVERTFVGDHNYGSPDRQLGIHLKSKGYKHWSWGASIAKAGQDPDNKKLDFDSTATIDKGDDWSEGWMLGGRIEFHPLGIMKMKQGDMKRKTKWFVGIGAFTWSNDDDNLDATRKDDVDSVTGFEISSGFRVNGFSVDAQYNTFNSELFADANGAKITSGLYKNGETDLKNYSLEGGYMILPKTLELVLGYQVQDADGYSDDWKKVAGGINYFVKGHDIKYQLTYVSGANKDGDNTTASADVDELYIQAQYVF